MFAAFKSGEVTVVAPVVATSPLFTLIVSAVIWREERFSKRTVLGACLIVAGVSLILLR